MSGRPHQLQRHLRGHEQRPHALRCWLHGVSGGHVEPEEVEALVMIGRSMLDLDEDAVEALARGLQERVDGALAA